MPEYSLYKFETGQLRIFGRSSTRAKFKTPEEAIYEAQQHINKLVKLSPKGNHGELQIAIVEYNGAYNSRIIAFLSNTDIQTIPFSA